MATEAEKDMDFTRNRKDLVALLTAAKDGDEAAFLAQVAALAARGMPEADVVRGYKDGKGRTSLHFAANFGHLSICTAILGLCPDSVNLADEDGAAPLLLATLGAKLDVMRLLLERGADVNQATAAGKTSLHVAAEQDYQDALEVLLEAGADVSASGQAGTALIEAAAEGSIHCLESLLGQAGIAVDARSPQGLTALLAASAGAFRTCCSKLVAAGADVAATGTAGLCPLHFAAERGDAALCRTLVGGTNGEAAARVRNDDGLLAVELAAGNAHSEVVDLLLPLSGLDAGTTADALIDTHKARVEAEAKASTTEASAGAGAGSTPSAGSTPLPPEPASDAAIAKADEFKALGNKAFGEGDMETAILHYSRGIDENARNHVLWSNRSAALLKLGQLEDALVNAEMCRRLKPDWPKAYFREGQALLKLNRYEDAAVTFYEGVRLDNENADLADALKTAIRLGKKHHKETGRTQ